MKTYYVKFPGSFYPLSFEADTEADARAAARRFIGKNCKRLPNGTDVWEFTPQSRNIVRRSWDRMRGDYAKAGQIFEP